MPNDEDLVREGEDLRMLYQISIDDIKVAKGRQWATIYYTLLTFGAIIGFYALTKGFFIYACWPQRLCLLVPAYLVNLLGMFHLVDTQKCLCEYRMRLRAIKEGFTIKAKKVLDITVNGEKEEKKYYGFGYYFWTLVFPFIFLMAIGMFYITWLLLYKDFSMAWIILIVLLFETVAFLPYYICNRCKVQKAEGKLNEVLNLMAAGNGEK